MATPRTTILPSTGGRKQTTTTVSGPRGGMKIPPLDDNDGGRGEPTGGGAGRMLHYLQAGEGVQWTPPPARQPVGTRPTANPAAGGGGGDDGGGATATTTAMAATTATTTAMRAFPDSSTGTWTVRTKRSGTMTRRRIPITTRRTQRRGSLRIRRNSSICSGRRSFLATLSCWSHTMTAFIITPGTIYMEAWQTMTRCKCCTQKVIATPHPISTHP